MNNVIKKKSFSLTFVQKILKIQATTLWHSSEELFSIFREKSAHAYNLDLRCFADKHDLLQFAKVIMKVRSP